MNQAENVVVCFGDSNTYGSMPMRHRQDVRRLGPDQRWPGVMAGRLGPTWRLVEEGLPGRTTVHADPIEGAHLSGLAAVPVIIGSHSPIDTIILMLGVNDFKARFGVGAGDIAASVEVLVESIRAWSQSPGRKVPHILLVAPPPILEAGCLAEMYRGGRAKSEALGELLRQSAERLGTSFLNAATHIHSSELDGIHLDEAEHYGLGVALSEQLRASA